MFAYYRGSTAYVYKLAAQYGLRFVIYDNLLNSVDDSSGEQEGEAPFSKVLAAAIGSALITTLVVYPLDLAHGRMGADMSKKPALIKESSSYKAGAKGNKKTLAM